MALLQLRFQKILRELLQNPDNSFCFCCSSKGPTYIFSRFNVFICQACSEQCRKFSWRVKPVTRSNFSEDEINRLKAGGNKVTRDIFLAGWSPNKLPLPTPGDASAVLRFLEQTFVHQTFKGIPSVSVHTPTVNEPLKEIPSPPKTNSHPKSNSPPISNYLVSLDSSPKTPFRANTPNKPEGTPQTKENTENYQPQAMDIETDQTTFKSPLCCIGSSKKQISPLKTRTRKPPNEWWNAQPGKPKSENTPKSQSKSIAKILSKTISPFKMKKFEVGHLFKPLKRYARFFQSPVSSPFKLKTANENLVHRTPERVTSDSSLLEFPPFPSPLTERRTNQKFQTPQKPVTVLLDIRSPSPQPKRTPLSGIPRSAEKPYPSNVYTYSPWRSPLAIPRTPIDYYSQTPIKFDYNSYTWGEAVMLPDETLIMIFGYLISSRDLCSLACVSLRWRAIADDCYLWKPLFLLHWGATGTMDDETWKSNFLRRKSEVLMQQIKSGRSYANKRKRQELSSQMSRSNSGLIFKRLATSDNGIKKKTHSKEKFGQPSEELMAFFQEKAAYFDQFSDMELPTTPQKY